MASMVRLTTRKRGGVGECGYEDAPIDGSGNGDYREGPEGGKLTLSDGHVGVRRLRRSLLTGGVGQGNGTVDKGGLLVPEGLELGE